MGLEVPRIHDLLKLASKISLELTDEQKSFLDEVTTYNLRGRYPDYKELFKNRATREFSTVRLNKIKEMRQWIKHRLAE